MVTHGDLAECARSSGVGAALQICSCIQTRRLGLCLLMDQSLDTGCLCWGNNIKGGGSLQPKALFSQHFWQLGKWVLHLEGGYLSGRPGLACGSIVLGVQALSSVLTYCSPSAVWSWRFTHTSVISGKGQTGTGFSFFSVLSKCFFHLDMTHRLYILFHWLVIGFKVVAWTHPAVKGSGTFPSPHQLYWGTVGK